MEIYVARLHQSVSPSKDFSSKWKHETAETVQWNDWVSEMNKLSKAANKLLYEKYKNFQKWVNIKKNICFIPGSVFRPGPTALPGTQSIPLPSPFMCDQPESAFLVPNFELKKKKKVLNGFKYFLVEIVYFRYLKLFHNSDV